MAKYGSLDDGQLVDLLKSGDRDAFEEIYNRYKYVLHNHAWNKVRNKEEAQDTIQEVFTALWSKRESINIGNNLPGYLYTCVRNHILNVIVRKDVQNKYISSIQQFAEAAPIITDHRVRENMLKSLIDKEVSNLPPRMRTVFELSRNQHLSHKEIAAIMGTSEQTVKKQVTKALKTLRTKLGLCLTLAFF